MSAARKVLGSFNELLIFVWSMRHCFINTKIFKLTFQTILNIDYVVLKILLKVQMKRMELCCSRFEKHCYERRPCIPIDNYVHNIKFCWRFNILPRLDLSFYFILDYLRDHIRRQKKWPLQLRWGKSKRWHSREKIGQMNEELQGERECEISKLTFYKLFF